MTPVLPMVAYLWLPPLLLSSVAELLVEGTEWYKDRCPSVVH